MVWQPAVHYSPIQDSLENHVVVVRGFSKVLAIQSWRLGYLVSSESTTSTLMRIADPIYICAPFLQHAVGRYLLNYYQDFANYKKEVGGLMQRNWRSLSVALQNSLGWQPLEPSGSMYGMFLHKDENDMEAVKKALAQGVGVCPGSMFFGNNLQNTGYVRIHCGVSEEKTNRILENLKK